MSLPTLVCLKSEYNYKYLQYRSDNVVTKGFLRASGESITDPSNQFEVVKAKEWGDLVHIKSRYNDRYLTRFSPGQNWIVAAATEPNEDLTNWSCTCFRAFHLEGETHKIRLVHEQLGTYARIRNDEEDPYDLCLDARSDQIDPNDTDVFFVVDLEELFPNSGHFAFKGDNGKYLGPATVLGSLPGLQFSYDDPNDPKVRQEVFFSPNGTLCIKSHHYGKFWSLGTEQLILVDKDDPRGTTDAGPLFRASLIDIGIVSLLNLYNNSFVTRSSLGIDVDTLRAVGDSIDDDAKFWVFDLDK